MKKYQAKVYELDGTYKSTISPKDILTDIKFGKNMNGGLTTLNIELDKSFDNTDYSQGDVIKVTAYDDNNTSGLDIYTGVVGGITRQQNTSRETVTLNLFGMTALLNQVIYESGASKVFSKNDDPADIVKDIIDYVNTIYTGSWFSYSGGNISTYGTTVDIDFDYDDCFSAIKKCLETTNFYRYIDETGDVTFKLKPASATHNLTNKKDVDNIVVGEDTTELVNKLHVQRKGGTYQTYTDATSQTNYGVKEKKINKTELVDAASQDEFGNNYIAENKDPKKETKITVNSDYNIESINPGDTIKVLNFSYSISNLQILKVDYSPDYATLTLDKLVTFGQEVNFTE